MRGVYVKTSSFLRRTIKKGKCLSPNKKRNVIQGKNVNIEGNVKTASASTDKGKGMIESRQKQG